MSERVQVIIITPGNKKSLLKAANDGDFNAREVVFLIHEFLDSAKPDCRGCGVGFNADKEPEVCVVVFEDKDEDAHVAGFCDECVNSENYEQVVALHLEKVGVVPVLQ
jgi:hypothetical protein